MAKKSTAATIDPNRFSPSATILMEDAIAVIEQANYTAANDAPVLLSLAPTRGAGAEWPEVAMSGYQRRYFGRVLIGVDAQSLRAQVRATLQPGASGNLRLTVGGAVVVMTFGIGGATVTSTKSLAVASTGTGWQEVELELESTTYVGGLSGLEDVTIQVEPILAADLPDPD